MPAQIETPRDLESPDCTGFVIPVDAKRYIEYYHQEVRHHVEAYLGDRWRIVSIEQRPETLYEATETTQAEESPTYVARKILAVLDIVAVRNGPVIRMEDDKPVPIPRRKLRLKAELQDDEGTFKIVESDVDAPKRRGGF